MQEITENAHGIVFVHYDPSNGEIMSYGNTRNPIAGRAVIAVPLAINEHPKFDPKKQKIDIENGVLVDKTADEQAAALLPTLPEIRVWIYQELQYSDQFTVSDRPLSKEQRESWITYRQTLRDLSKLSTPQDMVKAWPSRPDNSPNPFRQGGKLGG